MIKGINKNVIDICQTGNQYYERAILFLKPEYSDIHYDILKKEAKKFIKEIDTISSLKEKNMFFYWLPRLGGAAVIGGFFSFIIFNLL